MRKLATAYGIWTLLALAPVVTALSLASPAAAQAPASAYSSKSLIGTLLENPQTKAVLTKIIPAVVNNPMIDMARELSLEGLAPYEPALTQQVLMQIDAELSKIK